LFAVRSPFLRNSRNAIGVVDGQAASSERGTVTAEFALTLPAVALVLVCCLSGVQLAGLQVRLHDAAAVSARSLARDESPGSVSATASALVASARLTTQHRDDLVCATVSAPARNALLQLLPITLSASSCALAGGK
jgi:Flp pilus assembly protein TadG